MINEARAFGGGRLDLLINCAGAGLFGKFVESPDDVNLTLATTKKVATNEDWKNAFALNFFGALYGCRHALPIMIGQGGGQIVNIISGIAFSPMAYQSMYAATKAALNALTLSLRAEYAHYGIKFNSATPGTTATAIFDGEGGLPPGAQTPRQSARCVLNGVANDDRLILGDDGDLEGAGNCFVPNPYGKVSDKVFLYFARARKKGQLSFAAGEEAFEAYAEMSDAEKALLRAMADAAGSGEFDMEAVDKKLRACLAQMDLYNVPEAYFAGKTAAVTGAASGVGLALCEELLRHGAKRAVLADCNRAGLDALVERLNGLYPGQVRGVVCDVADEEEARAMVAAATEFFENQFDILINCAGIGQSGMFSDVPDSAELAAGARLSAEPPERWEQLYSVNFYGPLYGCRAVLPVMLRQGNGQIVNIISGTAFSGMPYQSAYASTKAALNALTLVLRYEYWDEGIKFNSATPGTTATAIFGSGPVPANAQTPRQAALRILSGIARNERLIAGSDDDAINAMLWGNVKAARFWDKYFADEADSIRTRSKAD